MAGDTSMQTLTFLFAFIAVLALIGVAAWLVRRFATNRLGANTNRGRMPRLAVIDAAAVDGRRRLVLVRRDNVEHLLMIGGPTDIVVEPNIVRATPGARPDAAARPASAAPSRRGLRRCPMPAWAEAMAAAADPFDHAEPQMPEPPPRPARPSFADEVRRPAAPPLAGAPQRSAGRLYAGADRRRSRSAASRVPSRCRRACRAERSEPMMPRPPRPSEPPKAPPPVRAPERAAAPPPPPAAAAPLRRDVQRRPESRRDGAAAGSCAAPPGRRAASSAPPVAPEPPPAAPRAQRGAAGAAARRRRAALKISKTRWRRCWAARSTPS